MFEYVENTDVFVNSLQPRNAYVLFVVLLRFHKRWLPNEKPSFPTVPIKSPSYTFRPALVSIEYRCAYDE